MDADIGLHLIHGSELQFTYHWHTRTSILSLLQSPLAVSWQRLLTREILLAFRAQALLSQTPVQNSCQLTAQLTGYQSGGRSHQSPSLLFTGWLSTDNWNLSLTNQLLHFTSLHSMELPDSSNQQLTRSFKVSCLKHLGTDHIENTDSIVTVQQYLDRRIETDVCLSASCIATTVLLVLF
jgi:hypothetical protein